MVGQALVGIDVMRSSSGMRRREFLSKTLSAVSGASLASGLCVAAENEPPIPVVVFSKVYQELKLSFDEAADLTAEVGPNGAVHTVQPDKVAA